MDWRSSEKPKILLFKRSSNQIPFNFGRVDEMVQHAKMPIEHCMNEQSKAIYMVEDIRNLTKTI